MIDGSFDPSIQLGRLILASTSPRRRDLLRHLGVPFDVASADVSEVRLKGEPPEHMVERLALVKGRAVQQNLNASRMPASYSAIVAADTSVVDGDRTLGKPENPVVARSMLRTLSGRTHRVITGVCIVIAGKTPLVDHCATEVTLRPFSDKAINRYVESGAPLDKAGAYAIQNREFQPVAATDGCIPNVIGLPLCLTARLLRAGGYPVAKEWGETNDRCPCRSLNRGSEQGERS